MEYTMEPVIAAQDLAVRTRREKPVQVHKPRARKAPPPALPVRDAVPIPRATFEIISSQDATAGESNKLRPRLGRFILQRDQPTSSGLKQTVVETGSIGSRIEIKTPGMICGTRRGMVKHLSRDNVALAKGVGWIHVPLEDFLEQPIPVPAYHPSSLPLHGFLAHPPSSHIVSLSLRSPQDNQNMPANTNAFIQVRTVRGVRKVGIDDWVTWCKALRPDLIWALVDTPKTLTGVADVDSEAPETGDVIPGEGRQTSQKRTTKSMDRSWLWVEKLVRGMTAIDKLGSDPNVATSSTPSRSPIIVPLMGGCDPRARAEFSKGLVDKLDVPIPQRDGSTLKQIEGGITGYAIDFTDLPFNALNVPPPVPSVSASPSKLGVEANEAPNIMLDLLRASLDPLETGKLRIALSAPSPHIILRLIAEAGLDLFDASWLAEAADLGIALDFRFPAPQPTAETRPIGHNLFEERFSTNFQTIGELDSSWPCQPVFSDGHLLHSRLDSEQWEANMTGEQGASKGFTRAYVHHLLHTHEMGAYALLHLHNLAMMDRFFESIRSYMSRSSSPELTHDFKKEITRFYETYDLPGPLFEQARSRWREVENARGKGSLKRERDATLRSVQEAEGGAPVFAVDDAHPREGMPNSDAIAVVEEAIEAQM